MKKQESLFQSTLLLTIVGVVTQGVGFYYRMALSQMIGAEFLGLYQLVMPVYAVLQSVAISGLAVAVSNRSAASMAQGRERDAISLLRTGLGLLFGIWTALSAGILLLDEPIAQGLLGDGRTAPALPCLLPCLLLTGVENLTKHHFYGLGETKLPAAVELTEQVIRAGAVLGLLAWLRPADGGHTVALIVLGMGVSEVFSSSLLSIARWRRRPRGAAALPSGEARAALLSIALPVGFTALLGNLMGAANSILVPRLLMRSGLSPTEAMEAFGVVFGMTMPLLTMPFALIGALSLAILPRLTHCATLGQHRALKEHLTTALSVVSFLVLPSIALVTALGGGWGELLFHDNRVGDFLLPLSIGVALSAWESILSAILNGINRQNQGAAISLLCGGIQLAFTLLLTERLGFCAYALGAAVSSLLGVVLRLREVCLTTGYRPDWFRLGAAPALGSLLLGATAGLFYRLLSPLWGMAGASLAGAALGIAAYAAALGALLPEHIRVFLLRRRPLGSK